MALPSNVTGQSTDRFSEDTNPLVAKVLYRGTFTITLASDTVGYSGSKQVILPAIQGPVQNPVAQVWHARTVSGLGGVLTPCPYALNFQEEVSLGTSFITTVTCGIVGDANDQLVLYTKMWNLTDPVDAQVFYYVIYSIRISDSFTVIAV